MCRAEGTDSESPKLKGSRHCVTEQRPRADRGGFFLHLTAAIYMK